MTAIRLGLIGSGISRSSAPRLHVAAGRLCGLDVSYDLRPLEAGTPEQFERALAACRDEGFTGVNVTHPYKEIAARLVHVGEAIVGRIAAVNTVRFGSAPLGDGSNTDHSGFVKAFRARFADEPPGTVAMIGAGGVGRPVAFGLAGLGAKEIRINDLDAARARRLAGDVAAAHPTCTVRTVDGLDALADAADGIVNCTPVGMYQYPGTPVPAALLAGRRWAFDVVYTPRETEFLNDARAAGAAILSGYELFFNQGVDAFAIFTGEHVEETALREALAAGD